MFSAWQNIMSITDYVYYIPCSFRAIETRHTHIVTLNTANTNIVQEKMTLLKML